MDRQITFFTYDLGVERMEQAADGRYDLVREKVATTEATSLTKSDIRRAIKDAGVSCPRGTEVYAVKTGKVRYRFSTEALMEICTEREELPLD